MGIPDFLKIVDTAPLPLRLSLEMTNVHMDIAQNCLYMGHGHGVCGLWAHRVTSDHGGPGHGDDGA